MSLKGLIRLFRKDIPSNAGGQSPAVPGLPPAFNIPPVCAGYLPDWLRFALHLRNIGFSPEDISRCLKQKYKLN